jgi:hypothetical protein
MGNRFLDPLSLTMANSGRLSITILRFFPLSLTDDALTKMICAFRSSKQPIDNFSYPIFTIYRLYGCDVFKFNALQFRRQTAVAAGVENETGTWPSTSLSCTFHRNCDTRSSVFLAL